MISIGQEGGSLLTDAKLFCYTCITIQQTTDDGKWVALMIQSYSSWSLCACNTNIVLKQTNKLIYSSFICRAYAHHVLKSSCLFIWSGCNTLFAQTNKFNIIFLQKPPMIRICNFGIVIPCIVKLSGKVLVC